MRHFDIAARDRDRVTILGSVMPVGERGRQRCRWPPARTTTWRACSACATTRIASTAPASMSRRPSVSCWGRPYSYERYNALSRSRQANPGVQFTDPSRNWATDATDRAHSWLLNAEIGRIAEKVDLRFSYDFSRARALYEYITGPVADRTLPEEVVVPTTLPTPTELPPTLSELQRGTMDVTYALASHLSARPVRTGTSGTA